jgi:iron complex outermembrane receptor protein
MRYLGSSSILAVLMAYAGSAAAQTQQTTQVSPDQSDCASIPGQATTAECAGSADAGQRTNSDLAAESPSPTAATGSDDIIVTGSRLNSGFASPTPVTVTTTSDLRAAAPASLTDAITQLPQFRNSSRASTAGPSGVRGNGASFLSLRGLEPQRTLTLLDGRRVVASSAAGSPDINLFPQDLISRVEVVTGGASAAYGSDAVAGVVNFILDKNFTGVRARVQAGISDEGDGGSRQAALSYGASLLGDRVHFIASAEYRATDEIPGAHSRPWADAAYAIIVNPNAPPARLIAPTVASNATFGGLIVGGPLANTQFLPGGVSAPFRFGTAVTSTTMIGGDGAPSQFGFTSGLESYSIFGRVTAEASESLSIFFEGSGARSTSGYDVSRSSQTAGTAFTIFADNAYLPQDIQAALARTGTTSFRLARVDRDFGFSRVAARSDTWRVAGGFDAKLGGDWHLEGYASHGANDYEVDTYNNPIYRRLFAAADAVVDPATKRIVCRSTLQGYDPGCVPVNLFGDGSVSAEARDYFMGTAVQVLKLRQDVASLTVRGSPLELPAGPLSIAAGFEYRREQARQTSDELSQTVISNVGVRGLPTSFVGQRGSYFLSNPQPLRGSYDVREGFVEAELPLLKDSSVGKSLSLNGAARLIDYSTVGSLWAWKAGAVYDPVEALRLRVTRSRDIRAANVSELFTGPVSIQGTVLYNNATTAFIGRRSGNPDLAPERADTLTAGAVFKPPFLPRFNLSVDYYSIDLKGAIAQLTPQQTIDQCNLGFQPACAQITNNGQLTLLIPTLNLSSIKSRGVDAELSYSAPLGEGNLRLRGLLSYLDKFETTLPGTPPIERAGDIGTSGTPRWGGTFSANYAHPSFDLFVQERFIGSGKIDTTAPPGTFSNNHVGSVWYTDLTAKWNVSNAITNGQFFITVNNLFDRQPPIVPTIPYGGYRSTNFSLYDVIGRYFTAGFQFKF